MTEPTAEQIAESVARLRRYQFGNPGQEAPTDGKWILVYTVADEMSSAYWVTNDHNLSGWVVSRSKCCGELRFLSSKATHWMPLPAPPRGE